MFRNADDDVGSHRYKWFDEMKSSSAHADMSRGLCSNGCCMYVEELTKIVDALSKVLKSVELTYECKHNPRVFSKLGVGRNLAINTVGRFTALINILRSGRREESHEEAINTLCNLVNGMVELRNVVKELLDEDCVKTSTSIRTVLEELSLNIDSLNLKMCILSLAVLGLVSNSITANTSGKLASALASLLFASLLSIHNDNMKSILRSCYRLNISIQTM